MRAFLGFKDLEQLAKTVSTSYGVFKKPENGEKMKLTIDA
jgi:hypothetical protein